MYCFPAEFCHNTCEITLKAKQYASNWTLFSQNTSKQQHSGNQVKSFKIDKKSIHIAAVVSRDVLVMVNIRMHVPLTQSNFPSLP